MKDCGKELKNAAAYLELHIEQGPVLLDLDLPLGAVLGTFGVERHAITFHGQAAHSGSTPMNRRKDAFLAAAKMSPEIYKIAERSKRRRLHHRLLHHEARHRHQRRRGMPHHAGPTPSGCRQRSRACCQEAKAASERFAKEGNVKVSWERLWQIDAAPVQRRTHRDVRRIHQRNLRQIASPALAARCTTPRKSPRAGVPTVMMFVQSLHGISHNKIEDTKEEHLEMCVTAFDKLAEKTMKWIQS